MSARDGIPPDVWTMAEAAATAPKALGGLFSENYIRPIAKAILAERKRCAGIASYAMRRTLAYHQHERAYVAECILSDIESGASRS